LEYPCPAKLRFGDPFPDLVRTTQLLRAAGGHALDGRELFRLGFKHLQRLDAKSGDELFRRRGADAAHDAGSEVV